MGSKAKAVEAYISEVATDEKVETDFVIDTEVVDSATEKPELVDLSVVNKTTFVELLRLG